MASFKKFDPPIEQEEWKKWVKKYNTHWNKMSKKHPELATVMSGVQHDKLKSFDKKVQDLLGIKPSKASVVIGMDKSGNATPTGFVALDKVKPSQAKPLLRVFQVK